MHVYTTPLTLPPGAPYPLDSLQATLKDENPAPSPQVYPWKVDWQTVAGLPTWKNIVHNETVEVKQAGGRFNQITRTRRPTRRIRPSSRGSLPLVSLMAVMVATGTTQRRRGATAESITLPCPMAAPSTAPRAPSSARCMA